jgi:hypothetical protein
MAQITLELPTDRYAVFEDPTELAIHVGFGRAEGSEWNKYA